MGQGTAHEVFIGFIASVNFQTAHFQSNQYGWAKAILHEHRVRVESLIRRSGVDSIINV
jgi:hypothetical protein